MDASRVASEFTLLDGVPQRLRRCQAAPGSRSALVPLRDWLRTRYTSLAFGQGSEPLRGQLGVARPQKTHDLRQLSSAAGFLGTIENHGGRGSRRIRWPVPKGALAGLAHGYLHDVDAGVVEPDRVHAIRCTSAAPPVPIGRGRSSLRPARDRPSDSAAMSVPSLGGSKSGLRGPHH